MRAMLTFVAFSTLALPGAARADHPRALGHFGDWIAATHDEAGQTVCYAFTRAMQSPGDPDSGTPQSSQGVVMSVTQRPTERDDVAIATSLQLRRDQVLVLDVGGKSFDFYTTQHAAFARDGADVVAALVDVDIALDHGQGPHDVALADQFSLHGFRAAYEAINRVCPEH